MPTLSDLSREMPSEEVVENFLEILSAEPSDRSAAIMAAGLLEQALLTAISSRLVDAGPTAHQAWFDAVNAPFGTFAAKIKLARALAIYGEKTEEMLSRVKDIRNVFAHRSSPIDFNHPTIIKEVKRLAEKPMIGEAPARIRYSACCLSFAKLFIKYAFAHGGTQIEVPLP